jgi:hypothetical protein
VSYLLCAVTAVARAQVNMKRRRVGIRGSVTPGQILTALPALFSGSHRTRPAAQRRQDRLDLPHETPIEALGLQWDDDAPADEREMSALQWDVLRKRSAATADVPKDGAANDTAADTSDVPLSGRPRSTAVTAAVPLSSCSLRSPRSPRSAIDEDGQLLMRPEEMRAVISRAGMSYADVDKTNQARWNSFPKIVDKTNKTWWGARKTPWGEITESDYVRLCAEPRLRQRAREALAALASQPTISLLASFEALQLLHSECVLRGDLRGSCVHDDTGLVLRCGNIATGYQRCLAQARSLGNRQAEMVVLGSLGELYAAVSQECKGLAGEECVECRHGRELQQAIDYHTQALTIAREIRDRKNEAAILGHLSRAYASLSSRMLRPGHLRYTTVRLLLQLWC